ncbi:unnamed protein product [Arctogadus glacialis]
MGPVAVPRGQGCTDSQGSARQITTLCRDLQAEAGSFQQPPCGLQQPVPVGTQFFDLISKAQSHRADDQRGLLNKKDLQLPDFLRLAPPPHHDPHAPSCSTPASRHQGNGGGGGGGHRGDPRESNGRRPGGFSHLLHASHQSQSLDSPLGGGGGDRGGGGGRKGRAGAATAPFPGNLSPIRPSRDPPSQMLEEDALSDLTLVGEGDIDSPHLSYVTPSALLPKPRPRLPSSRQQEAPPLAPPPPPPHDGGPPSGLVRLFGTILSVECPPPPPFPRQGLVHLVLLLCQRSRL